MSKYTYTIKKLPSGSYMWSIFARGAWVKDGVSGTRERAIEQSEGEIRQHINDMKAFKESEKTKEVFTYHG